MTKKEFIKAVEEFEKLKNTQREFTDELDKVLCKYTDNQNCTFTPYCAQACELGVYWLVRFAFPKSTAEQAKPEVDYFVNECNYGKAPHGMCKWKGKEYRIDGAGSFYDYLSDLCDYLSDL